MFTTFELTIFGALIIALLAILQLTRRLNTIAKKEQDRRVEERLKLLEDELDEYIIRSQKRLTVFKKVIDGVDGVIQNIKSAIDDDLLQIKIL